MFESKQEIAEAVDALYGVTQGLDRGDILTHDQIREILGLLPHEGQWDHIVHRTLRRVENERGIAYWPSINVGYKLLTKAEQLELPSWRLLKGIRQVRRARRSLTALPERELTVNQRRARQFMIEGLKEDERTFRRSLLDQDEQRRPTPVLPRRAVVAPKIAEADVHGR